MPTLSGRLSIGDWRKIWVIGGAAHAASRIPVLIGDSRLISFQSLVSAAA
jgi:hypothetical protein